MRVCVNVDFLLLADSLTEKRNHFFSVAVCRCMRFFVSLVVVVHTLVAIAIVSRSLVFCFVFDLEK